MRIGLIIGKFMPLHKGHLSLIDFAKERCDRLIVVLCYTDMEIIPGAIREEWLNKLLGADRKVTIISFAYDETKLPNTSVSSKQVSVLWGKALLKILSISPDIIFSSELYGNYVAEYMNAMHIQFDEKREKNPVSATQIRTDPFKYWEYIPEPVRPFFIKKIAVVGSESTGKSTLTEKLAAYFNTSFVPEMARDVIEHTEECRPSDLHKIAELHAKTIIQKLQLANKLLFSDTDLNITKSYSKFLFNSSLEVEQWVEDANRFDLYLFLETDSPYIQDGTRLPETSRDQLSDFHKQQFAAAGVELISIAGNWDERFERSCNIIKEKFLNR